MDVKAKYQPVADFLSRRGSQIQHYHADGATAVLEATVHNDAEKNRVWDEIKKVDVSFADLKATIAVNASVAAPTETYTVVSGDTLGKIAKHFYGNAGDYMKIFNANTDKLKNPDMIQVGQVLTIPIADVS
jgi:nucleoid-associated protein YgaU